MVIKAVVDRIEDGVAVLLSDDFGMEISIPLDSTNVLYNKGDSVSLTLEDI